MGLVSKPRKPLELRPSTGVQVDQRPQLLQDARDLARGQRLCGGDCAARQVRSSPRCDRRGGGSGACSGSGSRWPHSARGRGTAGRSWRGHDHHEPAASHAIEQGSTALQGGYQRSCEKPPGWMCQLTLCWMRPRVAEHFAQGSAMLTIELKQSTTFSELYSKHITLVSMLSA